MMKTDDKNDIRNQTWNTLETDKISKLQNHVMEKFRILKDQPQLQGYFKPQKNGKIPR